MKTFTILTIVAALVAPSTALMQTGHFQVELINEELVSSNPSLNDGYESTWYRYPQNSPPFWNEWWYDDPYIEGGKRVQVSFDYQLLNPDQPGDVFITINWTNGQWVGQNAPPTWANTANPELYIERLSDPEYNWDLSEWMFHLNPDPSNPIGHWDSGLFLLPIDYNPEWVSVDVQGAGNVGISNGVILHECVPEPATLVLLGLGGLLLRKVRA